MLSSCPDRRRYYIFPKLGILPHWKKQRQNRKNLFPFSGQRVDKNETKSSRGGYEGISPCDIVNCCCLMLNILNNYYYSVAGVLYVLTMLRKRVKGGDVLRQDSIKSNLFTFVFLILLWRKPTMWCVTRQRLLWEGQGLWEVWRRKDNKSLTVVLYFFLLRDTPSSPSVLIGSGEHPCAGRADVNRAWRTSAAGTNIPTSLLPFFHPSFFSPSHLIWIWTI